MRTTKIFIIVTIGVILMMAGIGALISATAPLKEVNVKTFGAKGDGKTDDTAAFERAIAITKTEGGVIKVPNGQYRLTRPLQLKSQTLIGATASAYVSDASVLPVLLPESMKGPCLSLDAGAAVHGLQFAYKWGGKEPSPRPAAIELKGVGCRVSDVKIFDAWDGIMADGINNVGRVLIEKCFLVNIHNIGIRMTGTWDSSWISKVEIWSPGSKHFLNKGIGFLIGKNDMLIMSDNFVFNANTAYKFQDKIEGCKIEGGMWGAMSNCTADFSGYGIVVEGDHTVSINGGTYWTHNGGIIVKGKKAQLRVSGLELASNGSPALNIQGGDLITVGTCQLRRLFKSHEAPAVSITGGNAVIVNGCVIDSTSSGIHVKEGLENVVLSNNIVREYRVLPEKDTETTDETEEEGLD